MTHVSSLPSPSAGGASVLNSAERGDVFRLLNDATHGRLTGDGERRLRFLMSAENPSAPVLPMDRLIAAGEFMVGVWLHFRRPIAGLPSGR